MDLTATTLFSGSWGVPAASEYTNRLGELVPIELSLFKEAEVVKKDVTEGYEHEPAPGLGDLEAVHLEDTPIDTPVARGGKRSSYLLEKRPTRFRVDHCSEVENILDNNHTRL